MSPMEGAVATFPRFGDVAHVGHVELFTPTPEPSLALFTSIVGRHESGRSRDSVYLRGWGDYEWHTLKLTDTTSGLGHLELRVRDVAITRDRSGAAGRLHHVTYMMDSREDVLHAGDIRRDADVPIDRAAQALDRPDVLPVLP